MKMRLQAWWVSKGQRPNQTNLKLKANTRGDQNSATIESEGKFSRK